MEENELEIGQEQVETIAYNIYKDINPYIRQNALKFSCWLLRTTYVVTIEGVVRIDKSSKYDICNYYISKNLDIIDRRWYYECSNLSEI